MKYTESKLTIRETIQDERDKIFWHTDVVQGGIRIAQVAGVGKEKSIANAERIVKVWNSHDKLTSALQAIIKESKDPRAVKTLPPIFKTLFLIAETALKNVK